MCMPKERYIAGPDSESQESPGSDKFVPSTLPHSSTCANNDLAIHMNISTIPARVFAEYFPYTSRWRPVEQTCCVLKRDAH